MLFIEEKEDVGLTFIHLEYGVIFDLLGKEKNSLTLDERDILLNYESCLSMFKEIEDQGDVYLLSQEY